MAFVPASQTSAAERDVFINHGGAYWLNPVPGGTFRSRSACTSMKPSDTIDPFGNPKRPDMPDLFGKSRYSTANRGPHGMQQGTGGKYAHGEGAAGIAESGDYSGRNGAMASAAQGAGGAGNASGDSGNMQGGSAAHAAVADGAMYATGGSGGSNGQSASYSPALNDTHGDAVSDFNGSKVPYSAEELIREGLPLDTANPERRILHPGNHTERIPPTGGSEYNGTVTEPWAAPKAVDNTYLRMAPLYESTTHYQLRTGRHYTEDEAPPHGMTLPLKSSLIKREW
ncbi:hypothetical protein DQ04_01201140 [Trypanosoma grayi]|uniref:hypothetical protein n=1 Tax=Trypanosoma grayi TaxID=71804 RepID=UPI0004F41CDC|nr:hypothetical protein DQ04_01201140 [Trypanosoma grayi]KEG13128.1 hypothetical protein DQ04_01201140 [Trypanosoma grayi]